MESFFVRFKNALILIAVLLAMTLGLAIQVRRPALAAANASGPDAHQVYLLRYWVASVLTPVERLVDRAGSLVFGIWDNYIDLRRTRRQNTELQQQIAAMRLEQAAFAEDAIEGHRLQAMLGFQQHYVARTVAAQVIGTSGSDLSRILTLDKGAEDGLKPDMAVLTPEGVVGKLRDVFPHTAQLLLLNDPTSGAGVLLQSTRIRAVVRGTPTGRLQISNLTADARIKPGETVLTSGGDLVYPRGLPVGIIESIAPDPDHQPYTAIVVKSAANLFQLEEVLVITETQTGVSPQAQQDLARGAATAADLTAQAADSRRAADMLAERLPSLHEIDPKAGDPNATVPSADAAADPNAAPKDPGGVVPKPLPTLHSDHFTPGTTPPATALTPGARPTDAPAGDTTQAPAPVVRKRPKPAAPAAATPSGTPATPQLNTPRSPAATEEPPR